MNIVFLNGIKVSPENKISLFNPSFLYGINCFEGIRAYWLSDKCEIFIFDLKEHLDRLYISAQNMSFIFPILKDKLESEIHQIILSEKIQENVYIRITFFLGSDTSWSDVDNVQYIISIRSIGSNLIDPDSLSLGISTYRRITNNSLPPKVKAGSNYLNSRYALLEAQSKGYDGALFLTHSGYVSESTGSCIFFIKDKSIYTPSIDSDILIGVTRNRIIQLAKSIGIRIYENSIESNEINSFEAAFLAGTMIELKPVSKIENVSLNTHHILFHKVLDRFKKYIYGLEL